MSIKENKLIFRMSSYLTKKLAQEHFQELFKKIHKKLEKIQHREKDYLIDDVLENQEFKFANEFYYVEFTNKSRGVKLLNNTFFINYSSKKENIQKSIIKLLISKYSSRLIDYVIKLNLESYNFPITAIELKYVNSKWGHCTHDNKLMFNLKLLNAPIEVLNYVIFHEIAHIKHKNHSQTYWREVERFCRNYKNHRKILKGSPPGLFIKP